VKAYGLIAAFCGVFSAVYLQHSYGQSSPFLITLFLPPLLFGLVPAETLLLTDRMRIAMKPVRRLWNSGVATLTVGFLVRGVINISGRYTFYDVVYWLLSTGFFALAVFVILRRSINRKRAAAMPGGVEFCDRAEITAGLSEAAVAGSGMQRHGDGDTLTYKE
jgi:hypothetical protein